MSTGVIDHVYNYLQFVIPFPYSMRVFYREVYRIKLTVTYVDLVLFVHFCEVVKCYHGQKSFQSINSLGYATIDEYHGQHF